jgi:hypothetical protein
MTETKTPLQSLGINAGLIQLIFVILGFLGITFDEDVKKALIDAGVQLYAQVSALLMTVTTLLQIYGRWRAKSRIQLAE